MVVSLCQLVPETRPVDCSEVGRTIPAVCQGCLIQMRVHGGRKMRKRVADFGCNHLKCSVHGRRKMLKRLADFGCNRLNCSNTRVAPSCTRVATSCGVVWCSVCE